MSSNGGQREEETRGENRAFAPKCSVLKFGKGFRIPQVPELDREF